MRSQAEIRERIAYCTQEYEHARRDMRQALAEWERTTSYAVATGMLTRYQELGQISMQWAAAKGQLEWVLTESQWEDATEDKKDSGSRINEHLALRGLS